MKEINSTPAHLQAVKNYKKKVKRITVDFYPADEYTWNHLQSQEKKQAYIRDLIRADMEKGNR